MFTGNKKWFFDAKFGMFIHFGLYSLLAGEYRGQRMPFIGEWIQSYFNIPNDEYHQLTKVFNPIYFNADEWARLADDAGMKYMVVTSKHHEGFALYKSDNSAFNSADGTPFKRDIIEELANACAKKGLKFGLYYSQALDWSHPHGGGYKAGHTNVGVMSWTNDWDFPDNGNKNFTVCFEEKIKPQVKEILTQYGDLCLIWFDTPFDITKDQSLELYNMVKQYQPDCLINSRIGVDSKCDYKSAHDNEIVENNEEGLLYESPGTLNDTWGFKYYDDNWKSPERVVEIKNILNKRGINYLLNIGPDHLGRFPAPAIEILKKAGKLI